MVVAAAGQGKAIVQLSTVSLQVAPGARTVLVVDDHPIVRQGMAALLTAQPWVARVIEAGSVAEARRLTTVDRPDLAVVDLGLPDGDGIGLLRELAVIAPGCAAIVMTMTDDVGTVRTALDAGARGYLLKDSAPDLIVAALRAVAAGGRVLGPTVADDVPAAGSSGRPPPPFDTLTPRELRLAVLIARGSSNRQIADSLSISEKTVRNQIGMVLAKLGVADRVQAALLAHRAGLAD